MIILPSSDQPALLGLKAPKACEGVTQEMLRATIWTHPVLSKDSQRWRTRIENSAKRVTDRLTYTGSYTPADRRMIGTEHRDLVYGLLRRRVEPGGATADPADQVDLARWMGTAMAFAHDQIGLVGARLWQPGPHEMYDILDFLLGEGACLPWADSHPFPQWARASLELVQTRVQRREKYLYRPWKDVQENLLTFLAAFQGQIQHPFVTPWKTDDAVRGALGLRLLASQAPGEVSDALVECLVWLDSQLNSEEFKLEDTGDLRLLISTAWERSVLERVGAGADKTSAENPSAARTQRIM